MSKSLKNYIGMIKFYDDKVSKYGVMNRVVHNQINCKYCNHDGDCFNSPSHPGFGKYIDGCDDLWYLDCIEYIRKRTDSYEIHK